MYLCIKLTAMYTTYHFNSAQELSADILKAIKNNIIISGIDRANKTLNETSQDIVAFIKWFRALL